MGEEKLPMMLTFLKKMNSCNADVHGRQRREERTGSEGQKKEEKEKCKRKATEPAGLGQQLLLERGIKADICQGAL